MKQYFIWGMGLLGTSIALDLKKQGNKIFGCDNSKKNIKQLNKLGFHNIYNNTKSKDKAKIQNAILKSNGIILGTPIEEIYNIIEILIEYKLPRKIWITDVASTKTDLMNYINKKDKFINFIGSHPMAGSDLGGPQNAKRKMFNEALIYITTSKKMRELDDKKIYKKSIKKIEKFWKKLGAHPHQISFLNHDKYGAYLSHGLHLVSCMVSHLLKDIPDVFTIPYSPVGGSFRDITRVSGSNPKLWEGIISTNSKEVEKYLLQLENLVKNWRVKMSSNELSIENIFEEADTIRKKISKQVDIK